MAQTTIDSIKNAEMKSVQIIKEAEERKKQLLEEARMEVKVYEESVVSEAKMMADKVVKEAQATRNDELEAARRRAMAIVAQKKVGGEKRKAEAVDLVISEIR